MADIYRPPVSHTALSSSQQQDTLSASHPNRADVPSHLAPELPPNSWSDQPPTQAGNPRARVFVACQACRNRKIKCDGVKPVCTNCHKKEFAPGPSFQHLLPDNEKYKLANGICLYDQIPKRRGPDRTPGARVRKKYRQDESGHERGARRRATIESIGNYDEDSPIYPRHSLAPAPDEYLRERGPHHQLEDPRSLLPAVRHAEDRNSVYIRESAAPGPILTVVNADSATQLPPPPPSELYTLRHPSISRAEGARTLSPPASSTSSGSPTSNHHQAFARRGSSVLNSPADANGSIGAFYPPSQSFVSLRDAQSRSPLDGSGPLERQAHPNFPIESPIARSTRERHGSWSHSRASFSLPYTQSSYPAANPSYEYVPSAGAYVQSVEENDPEERYRESPHEVALTLPSVPGAGFVQKTWYDSLLDTYASFEAPSEFRGYYSSGSLVLTSEARRKAQTTVVADLRQFFARSSWWFSFIHIGTFWAKLHDPDSRTSSALQPGLVLAALALASFNKSSELEGGVWGRERAAKLRADAEAAVDNSLAVGWVDIGLAQAAWILAMYEICPHPYHTLQKARSAMSRLDNIIRLLKCSSVDADNPAVTHFDQTATPIILHRHQSLPSSQYPVREHSYSGSYVSYETSTSPTVYRPTLGYGETFPSETGYKSVASLRDEHAHMIPSNIDPPPPKPKGCCCGDLNFGKNSFTPLWEFSSRWVQGFSPAEIQREEARRIVWSYVTLASALGGHTAGLGQDRELDTYWSACAENFSLLFPGEAAFYENPVSHRITDIKNSVWSLYCRAELLWLACLRMRHSVMRANGMSKSQTSELGLYSIVAPSENLVNASSESDMSSFVMRTWLQTKEIEDALDAHTCGVERAFLFHGREHLSSIRLLITQDFSRYVPFPSTEMTVFNRHQANDWLKHQAAMVGRMMSGLQHITGLRLSILAHRPFFVWWFMIQLLRLLNLWARDRSMIETLELCFSFLPVIDYLTAIWPSENQKNKYFVLRQRLDEACRICGLPLPPPPNLNVEAYRELV